MSAISPLKEIPDLPDEVVQAGPNGELILFVGAGISMLLKLPSWETFARQALEDLRGAGLLDFAELDQLSNLSPRTQLSIAKLIATEKDYPLDLTKLLRATEGASIYKTLNDMGCTCVTTNYDELLAPRFVGSTDGSTTAQPVQRICEREQLFAKYLDDTGVVVHLHGAISKPETMVVSTKEYLAHYDHENLRHFLGGLFGSKTVLFLGYGLEENEILEHILRRGGARDSKERRRFALQGFFRNEQPLYEKLLHYYRASFGVHLLGYIRDNNDYAQQEEVIRDWAPKIRVLKPALTDDLVRMNEILRNE
jgi:hypothetical protein